MPFYSDMLKTNRSGLHFFDASVLVDLSAGFTAAKIADDANGEKIELVSKTDDVKVAEDILVHRNGRIGERDLSLDTIVIPIQKLAAMPDAVQEALRLREQVPEDSGRRPGVLTPKRPLPTDSKVIGGRL